MAESDELLAELAADLASQITRRYRVDRADAVSMILDDWRRQSKLVLAVASATTTADVRRLRVYREATAAAKRNIYHQLRRYRLKPAIFEDALGALARLPAGAPAELLDGPLLAVATAHVSTAERLPHRDEFLAVLTTVATGCGTVVDVGCGAFPLMISAESLGALGVREYWALDKDPHAQAALREYVRIRADQPIRPVPWNIANGWQPLYAAGLPRRNGLGLLLKVVPVVARQSPELLPVLAQTPADRLLISGSRIAMAKRHDIERRELRVIQRFCSTYGFRQEDEFRTADEVSLLVRRC